MRIFLFGWLWIGVTWGWAQPTEALSGKCAPFLRSTDTLRAFSLVVRDIPAFETYLMSQVPAARILHRYVPGRVAVLSCPPEVFWKDIAPRREVMFIDRAPAAPQPERAVPGHDLSVNHIRAVHIEQAELDGRGSVVSIKEQRFDSNDVDLRGRVLFGAPSTPQTSVHATLMATLVGGAGTSDPEGRGVARGVHLLSSSFVGLLPDPPEVYKAWNVGVQNHAYGTSIENYYSPNALSFDASTQAHPELVHVFSAGNVGDSVSTAGPYAGIEGFANLTGHFKMAKNILVVGAVDSSGSVQPFSSRGPAYDGRTKPDMVAYGPNGTSEAAALVSGASAVVQQCLREKRGRTPTSELVRAVLLSACDDVDAPGIDFTSGHGNLNLQRAVAAAQHHPLFQGTVAEGQNAEWTFDVPPKVHRLTVVLCWNDLPALPAAPKALVNDLDIALVGPDGTWWYPWVLNTSPHPDSLRQPARRGIDTLNNVERIDLLKPLPGIYTIRIVGQRVVSARQAFSAAVCLDTAGVFSWKSPLHGERAWSGQPLALRWQHNRPKTHGTLSYRLLSDSSWHILVDSMPLEDGAWVWQLPDTTAAAQVQMSIGTKQWVSDTFLIAPAVRLRVAVNCADSILLCWNTADLRAQYRLWGLGQYYLEPLFLTADTCVLLHKDHFPQTHFAVSVRLDSAETLPSAAPSIEQQHSGCYLQAFWGSLDEPGPRAVLYLTLGASHGVDSVFWEKWRHNNWSMLYQQVPKALSLQYEDENVSPGKNTYRVRLKMANSAALSTESISLYYSGPTHARVYPNPVVPHRAMTILVDSEYLPAQWQLFNALGQVVASQKLEEGRTETYLPDLPPGYYLWKIASDARPFATGILAVRP